MIILLHLNNIFSTKCHICFVFLCFFQPKLPVCSGAKCCGKIMKALAVFVFALMTGFFLVIFSLIVAGNVIQMMSVNQETGEVSYPEPTTALLIVGIVLLTNTLLLVSVASLVCAAIKKFRASRQTPASSSPTDVATSTGSSASSNNNDSNAGGSCESQPCVFASAFGRLRQLIPSQRPVNTDRGLYTPLVGSDTQTEMVSIENHTQHASHFSIQSQYPQVQMASTQAPIYASTGSQPAHVVYVPVSAQAMSSINML